MKIVLVCAAICALIALSSAAEYYPGEKGDCDYRCADITVPICAYNGRCYQKFQNRCFMDHYNCLRPRSDERFRESKDSFCREYKSCWFAQYNYKDYLIAGAPKYLVTFH